MFATGFALPVQVQREVETRARREYPDGSHPYAARLRESFTKGAERGWREQAAGGAVTEFGIALERGYSLGCALRKQWQRVDTTVEECIAIARGAA